MSVTILSTVPAVVEVEGRGYGTAENAASAAAKAAGYTVRGSKYFDETGAPTGVLGRSELALVFRGYRWIVEHEGRWFVSVPAELSEVA